MTFRIAGFAALACLLVSGCGSEKKAESAKHTPYDGGAGGPTNVQAAIDALAARVATLETSLAAAQADLATTQADLATTQAGLASTQATLAAAETNIASLDVKMTVAQDDIVFSYGEISVLQGTSGDHEMRLDALELGSTADDARLTALETKTAAISTASIDGKSSLVFTGVNVHIQSGSGATNGVVNGLGNLVVGYNELRGTGDVRTGLHNLVIGLLNNYSSFAGIVAGQNNEISGALATVTGGTFNTASAAGATVSGGENNNASGPSASVSGGRNGIASGTGASVSGGVNSNASGQDSSVSGGFDRFAAGADDWVAGALFQDI